MSSKIIMVSCQGDRLEIEGNLCIHIRLIREMIENLGLDISNMSESLEVPLGNVVDTKTMNLVKVYIEGFVQNQHSQPKTFNVPDALRTEEMEIEMPDDDHIIQDWEVEFTKSLDEDDLYNLMMAANYMDIPPLLELCTSVVANMIRGRPAEEIRKILGLECDFSAKDLEQIYLENIWLAD